MFLLKLILLPSKVGTCCKSIKCKKISFVLQFVAPCRNLVLLYDDSSQKYQYGGHKMNANKTSNNEHIHFISKPLASIT